MDNEKIKFHGLEHIRRAAPRKGKYLEFLSWKDAENVLQNIPAILLPLGSNMKEHGLHLPLNTDWLTAEYLTMRVLDLIPIAALPTMQSSYYPAFVEYPGSISLSKETARDLIIEVCHSITRHGPKKVYILNTGFSTNRPLEAARLQLGREGVVMEYLDSLKISDQLAKGVAEQAFGSHADEIETSMMMYILPESVKLHLAKPELSSPGKGFLTRNPNLATGRYSETGAWGDPTLATPEKGRIIIEALVEYLVEHINHFMSEQFVAPLPRQEYLD